MVFEPNFSKVVSSVRKNLGIMQTVIEVKLPMVENEISTIYSVGAKSTITKKEVVGKDIDIYGIVDFQVIYQGEAISALDYSAEFRDRFVTNEEMLGEVIVSSNVVDVTSNVSSGGVKVNAIVEIIVDEILSRDINALTSINGDNFVSTKEITYNSFVGKAFEKFEINENRVIDGVEKVLMVTPCVMLKSITSKDNYAMVNGVLKADITYSTGDHETDIKTKQLSYDFAWEVALSELTDESKIQSEISILYNEIKVSTTIENSSAEINLYVPIVYTGYVFNENKIDVVDDVYTNSHYLAITNETFNSLDIRQSVDFKDNISGSVEISDTAPFIDDIINVVTNNIVLASSNVRNNKITVEGIVNSTVMYYTKETGEITSVLIEMPFAIEEKVDGEMASVVTLCVSNIQAKSKRGKEIEVSAELCLFADTYSQEDVCVITDVVLGDEKLKDDCSLYIYLVKPNQTVWDIAKEMNVSQDLILDQNPEVELPLRGGERLVIYKPTIVEY